MNIGYRLTKKPIYFPALEVKEHIYLTRYTDMNLAVIIGLRGEVGKLSVNLAAYQYDKLLDDYEFFVTLDSKEVNEPCFSTGLFEVVTEPFELGPFNSKYQIWRVK